MQFRFRYRYLICFLAIIACFALVFRWMQPSAQELLNEAKLALARRNLNTAEQRVSALLTIEPHSNSGLLLAGDIEVQRGDSEKAIGFFDRIPNNGTPEAILARCNAGELLLTQKRFLSQAEAQFRHAVDHDPDNVLANDRLTYILGLETRSQELIPFQLNMIRLGHASPRRLYLLALGDLLKTDIKLIQQYNRAAPDDRGPLLALAKNDILNNNYSKAITTLRRVVERSPYFFEAQLSLGRLLLEINLNSDFLDWHSSLPESIEQHAGIWMIRGSWAVHSDELKAAARYFWEAIRRDPNHQQSNYQLGQILIRLNRVEQAAAFLDRASALQRYQNTVFTNHAKIRSNKLNPKELNRAVEESESLGLIWESLGWAQLLKETQPNSDRAKDLFSRFHKKTDGLPLKRCLQDSNPAESIDLSELPVPNLPSEIENEASIASSSNDQEKIAFLNQAAKSGISFSYFNDSNLRIEGLERVFHFTGGGCSVLDFDSDGWPDLYFTQGCRWPVDEQSFEHLDRLYRNLGNGQFEDVTASTTILENRYSQGTTVGDFNNDGFSDLYIANIGGNRLFENNGDGSFTDVTETSQTASDRWTTSCLMADLNGDGWPDIYAVNYLSGPDVFSRVCRNQDGVQQSCLPQNFPAAQDQMYLNLGDGRFQEVSAESGIVVPDGKGLGIVAADFDGSGKLSLFVANDSVANFFFVNETSAKGAPPRFSEQALIRGLAFNHAGRAEACMGVAAGDANGDGLIDLFVTNFEHESNTFYRHTSEDYFSDDTSSVNLKNQTLSMLGFGTQFFDADLDGDLDLIIVNGHIHDSPSSKMFPQFFRNSGSGEYVELKTSSLGAYFSEKHLGRGLACVDWNRDGLQDFVVSHLDSPVSVMSNQTSHTGRFLSIDLRGTLSSRDVVGASLKFVTNNRTLVRHLTAGDGYQASNERRFVIGVGPDEEIQSLEVRWPSGDRQSFDNLPFGKSIRIIEGCDIAFER